MSWTHNSAKNNYRSLISPIQSNPVLLKERVRIPRTRRAGGAAMLWRRLPLDGVGSCRLFFTDDLHDNLSWVPASDKPHTFKSCFTHSSQVFFGRPGPFLPGTGLDLTLFISPLERMTCPNHLSRRSRTRMARSHIPSLACSSSIDGSSDGLTPQIQRIIARSLRHSRWRAAEVMGQVSVPCNIELRTLVIVPKGGLFWLSIVTPPQLICDVTWTYGTGIVTSYSPIVAARANWRKSDLH